MSHAYDSVYANIFNSWKQDSIALCQYYSGRLPFEYLCAIRRFNFLKKLNNVKCPVLKQYFDNFDYHDRDIIGNKYDFSLFDSNISLAFKCWQIFADKLSERCLI